MAGEFVIDTDVSGPLFTGQAHSVIDSMMNEAQAVVGQIVVNEIKSILAANVKKSTGFYENHIVTNRSTTGVTIHETGEALIYGPWLEGVSRRNRSTRFRGYGAFRRAALKLQSSPKIENAIDGVAKRHLGRLE